MLSKLPRGSDSLSQVTAKHLCSLLLLSVPTAASCSQPLSSLQDEATAPLASCRGKALMPSTGPCGSQTRCDLCCYHCADLIRSLPAEICSVVLSACYNNFQAPYMVFKPSWTCLILELQQGLLHHIRPPTTANISQSAKEVCSLSPTSPALSLSPYFSLS